MTPVPEGYMRNAQGHLIPKEKVKPQHLLEDEMVQGLFAEAEEARQLLGILKARAFSKVADFRDLLADEYGVQRGGQKGNMTFWTYDGTLGVQIAVGESITFGPELEAAKTLIDECIMEWAEGSRSEIQALIGQAFQTSKQGKIDTARVLALRQLEIEDPKWQRAMQAISDAQRVSQTKTYVRFYQRDPVTKAETQLPLDIAGV
ncbi:MAG: DUF3164 family protein [Pseudomonadota bacterium]